MEGNFCKVLIGICEVLFTQPHHISICICSFYKSYTIKVEITFFIQRTGNGYCVAFYRFLCSIVLLSAFVTCDCYHYFIFARGNSKDSFKWCDVVVIRFGIIFQLIAKGIVAEACLCLTSGYVVYCTFSFCEAVTANCHIVIGQRLSIVCLAVCCAGQSHISSGNIQSSVYNFEGNTCEVMAYVVKVRWFQFHVVNVCICCFNNIISTKCKVIFCIQFIVYCYVITGYCFFSAIIFGAATVLGNGDNYVICNRGYLKGSRSSFDIVVDCLGAAVQSVSEFIIT